jgi:hypothetical protein
MTINLQIWRDAVEWPAGNRERKYALPRLSFIYSGETDAQLIPVASVSRSRTP